MKVGKEQSKTIVSKCVRGSQVRLMSLLQSANVTILSAAENSTLWVPGLQDFGVQGSRLFFEQGDVVNWMMQSLTSFMQRSLSSRIKQPIVLGKPGSKKIRIASIVVLLAWKMGWMATLQV